MLQLKHIVLIFILIVTSIHAQNYQYRSDCDWDKVVMVKDYKPELGDTCIIFASVRGCDESEKIFMGYDCDKDISVHYFHVYFKGNRWICVPKKNLTECLNGKTGLSAVMFVEGFGRTFTSALDRATKLSRTYHNQVIMFDWPTYRPQLKATKNYKLTREESQKISLPFANFLDSINHYKLGHPSVFKSLSLIMHSMGNLLMMHAVKNNHLKIQDTLFDAVVLNAACVPQKKHAQWVQKLNIQKKLYLTRNNHDKVLNGAKLISGFQRQLGQRIRKPYASNALYLDFSRVLDSEHNYFLYRHVLAEHPYCKELYQAIFDGIVPDFSNENRYIKKPKKNRVELFDLKEAQKGGIGISIGI